SNSSCAHCFCHLRACWILSPHCRLILFLFLFSDTATTEIYTLSLHDALPICSPEPAGEDVGHRRALPPVATRIDKQCERPGRARSEEHTSELQSHLNLVCRLLLEKKNIFLIGRRARCNTRRPSKT